jgi:hypothetical protein
VRQLLAGTDVDVPASLAMVVGAQFIAEVRRQPTIHLINLAALDLIDRGTLNWQESLAGQAHPLGRGGGVREWELVGKPMAIDLVMQWLSERSLPEVVTFEPSNDRAGEAADRPAVNLVAGLLRRRMDSLEDASESQMWTVTGEAASGANPAPAEGSGGTDGATSA